MALRTRVWSAGKLLVLGGALLATYVLFAVASMRVAPDYPGDTPPILPPTWLEPRRVAR